MILLKKWGILEELRICLTESHGSIQSRYISCACWVMEMPKPTNSYNKIEESFRKEGRKRSTLL
jgi:hypothetical protein